MNNLADSKSQRRNKLMSVMQNLPNLERENKEELQDLAIEAISVALKFKQNAPRIYIRTPVI